VAETEPDRAVDAPIVHNSQERRFETTIDGELAEASYILEGDTIKFTHTQVPVSSRNQGVGANLAKTALDYARNNGLTVVPICSFIQTYLKQHTEYADLVKGGGSAQA
jgi:predicted GNAT family acetyltransferase